MSENKKSFNLKIYAIAVSVAVAAALIIICTITFSTKYTAFHPEELARTFVNTIVQTGDGYNAYKNTMLSKSSKYGDYIREYYITPAVKRDAKEGENDYSHESFKGEKTLSDDGTLKGRLTEKMYPVYVELVDTYSWDDYDSIFGGYIEKLIVERENIFGDKFFNDEVFFSAFESNVSTYGKSLTGTKEEYDENSGVKLSERTVGAYEKRYGEDYKLICTAMDIVYGNKDEIISSLDYEVLKTYGFSTDDIKDTATVTINVTDKDNNKLCECKVYLIKIGMSWYVDNLSTDTDALYKLS